MTVPSDGAADRPIVLSGLNCTGTEDQLEDCAQLSDASMCTHSDDAGARCSKETMK